MNSVFNKHMVSVVIPSYLQGHYLEECISSVIAQSYKYWEIIIVNDGSSDETTSIAKLLIKKYGAYKIRLVDKINSGVCDARNAGIKHSNGHYILCLDADDKIHPELLNKMTHLLDTDNSVGIAYCDWQHFGSSNLTHPSLEFCILHLYSVSNYIPNTSLFRKSAWQSVGGYNRNMTAGLEDWDFWIAMCKKGFLGKRIPEPLYYYRIKDTGRNKESQKYAMQLFSRIVLNHPEIYGEENVNAAIKVLAHQNLPSTTIEPISQEIFVSSDD